MNIELVF